MKNSSAMEISLSREKKTAAMAMNLVQFLSHHDSDFAIHNIHHIILVLEFLVIANSVPLYTFQLHNQLIITKMQRRAIAQALSAFKRSITESTTTELSSYLNSRSFSSNLPEDIASAARLARFPPKRSTSIKTPTEAITSSSSSLLNTQAEGAKIVSSWMFPWERRQMEGGKLKPWEKLYWGAFVVAVSLFLFNRLPSMFDSSSEENKEDPEAVKKREEGKKEAARRVAAGESLLEIVQGNGGVDPFDGEDPEVIETYVKSVMGLDDPYEGLSPEEINILLAKEEGLK
jgi:hypothetical protein